MISFRRLFFGQPGNIVELGDIMCKEGYGNDVVINVLSNEEYGDNLLSEIYRNHDSIQSTYSIIISTQARNNIFYKENLGRVKRSINQSNPRISQSNELKAVRDRISILEDELDEQGLVIVGKSTPFV